MMVKSTLSIALLSSLLCLCSQTRAQGYADTSLAAVTAALAYVRPSPTVPASTDTSSLASIQTSGGQQPVFGQDGALLAEQVVDIMSRHTPLHMLSMHLPGHAPDHSPTLWPMQLCSTQAVSLLVPKLFPGRCQIPSRTGNIHCVTLGNFRSGCCVCCRPEGMRLLSDFQHDRAMVAEPLTFLSRLLQHDCKLPPIRARL